MEYLKNWYFRMGGYVHHRLATPVLAVLFFIEAIFFIPVDPLLILYCLERRKKALWYATIATISSVAGGFAGYLLGYSLWEAIGQRLVAMLFSPERFEQALMLFKTHEIGAVLIAGFTPVPYKLVTIGAGFCRLPLAPFILCSFISRGARFFMIGAALYWWGERVKEIIDKYFDLFALFGAALAIAGVWVLYW